MSDLLRIGASGVSAYRTALSVIGDNVANSETQGYARRDVSLSEVGVSAGSPTYRMSASGTGVAATSVNRAWDDFKAADARNSSADASRAGTRAQWLGAIETAMPDGDSGVSATVTGFFTAATKLAAAPTSAVSRAATLSALGDAVGAITATATRLTRVAEGIASEAGSALASVNANLAALADVNQALARTPAGTSAKASLADQRDRLLDDLSGQIGAEATIASNGTATVTLAGSDAPLVTGNQAARIDLATAAEGALSLSIGGAAITLTGGSLAGLVDAAAATATARTTLDTIATDFTGQINAWQARGQTPAGAPGQPLLTITEKAATLMLATAAPAAIAAASGDSANGNLAILADLRGADGAEARLSALVNGNAQALASANAAASAAGSRRDAAMVARNDASGVDLDREAAELIRFQQAYDGSARVIQVARETLQSILSLF
ncbi:MAG: flagellar hook-associated protein FlgK [Sphingomonas bacterium]|nr:flagellar hook-associated protein FlgK [Sphingomonas bacterium]